MCSHPMMLKFAWVTFVIAADDFCGQRISILLTTAGRKCLNSWIQRNVLNESTAVIYFYIVQLLIVYWFIIGVAIAARLAFGKSSSRDRFGLAVVFVFLDPGLFLRALTKTDKMGNCHKIIPQWVNMSCICTGDFIFWLSDVFLEFASIPFQFISSHKSEPCIPFPASLALHFRWFWPLSLFRLFS